MRTDPAVFSQRNAQLTRSPRYVIELSFAEDNSTLWYFTSHADIQIHAGANAVLRVAQAVSVTSQTLNPDTAAATIGKISFDLVDYASAVTNALGSELLAGRTARRRRVRVFYGFEGMQWRDPALGPQPEYGLIQTQIVTLVEFDKGAYHFTCADIQRVMRQEIFKLAETNLSASLGATRLTVACLGGAGTLVVADASAFPTSGSGIIRDGTNDKDLFTWTGKTAQSLTGVSGVLAHGIGATVCDAVVNVYNTAAFTMVAHGTSYSDLPSTTAGYGKIDKEVFSYTSKTSTTFLGVVRGALNTFAVEHVVDGFLGQDRRPKVSEYVYLELPVVDMAYRILTGKDRFGNPVMPTTWNLGIPTSYVRLADFTGIGTDIWDLSDDDGGLVGLLQDIGRTDGKRFIESEINLLAGCFMPVYADGSLGFKRMSNVLAGAAYTTLLDESNVVSWGPLVHDYDSVHNIFEINWNWEPSPSEFTRKTDLVEFASALLYPDAPVTKLNFRLLNGRRHTSSTIALRFDALRDRYSGPPQRITVNGLHRLNQLEVGEVVRLRLANVRDFAAPNGHGPIDRSFEVQNISVNWMTGQLSVQLFATSRQAGPLAPTADATVLTHAWYISEGTALSSVVTITGSNPGHITGGPYNLTGHASLLNAAAIYYYSGDLQQDPGVDITVNDNVWLRIEGFFQENGTISGRGRGINGAAAPLSPGSISDYAPGTIGFLGNTEAGGGFILNNVIAFGPGSPFLRASSVRGGSIAGLNAAVPELNLAWDGTLLSGLPSDLRGSSGSSGMPLTTGTFLPGGAGGKGGAGLAITSRGMAIGASGRIDLSGGAGVAGAAFAFGSISMNAGGGAGGAPGALLVILDGTANTATGLTEAGAVAQNGVTPIAGRSAEIPDQWETFEAGNYSSYFVGTGDGSSFPLPSLSGALGGNQVQYVPGNQTPQADPFIPRLFGFEVVSGSLTGLQVATETIQGGPGGNIALTTIQGVNLVALTITAAQIANATITSTQIASATITGSNIATATITSGNIQDATIIAADIASATIVGSNIASATIAGGNIANVTITATNIANLTITAAQIANATITGAQITNATITGALIASATITGGNISGGTITGSNIAGATITGANIVGATITGANIAASTITSSLISVSQLSAISADIGDITAGSIRGVNVNASSHTTKGSYLTSAPGGGAGTLDVKNTADFPSSGSGWIIDTTNNRDAFTYTGKTATTLTGCSGVLAHNAGATIIPLAKCMVIDGPTNEMLFYGDRGDGTIEILAAVGVSGFGSQFAAGTFGSIASTGTMAGVVGYAGNNPGVMGQSDTGSGVTGLSNSEVGGAFNGNATRGNLQLLNCNGSTFPTNKGAGQLAQVGGRLFYADGANWLPLTHPYFESSEQTLTASTDAAAAHGLGRVPKLAQLIIRCKTAEFGYAVNDEVSIANLGDNVATARGPILYVNSTNVGFVVANSAIGFLRRDAGNVGIFAAITLANWKAVLRAW